MNLFTELLNEYQLYWGELYYFREDIEMIFSAQKKIITNSENYISELEKELKSKVQKDSQLRQEPANVEEGSYQTHYYEHYYGETVRAIEQIIENQRRAAILSIFSLIEGQLKILCHIIQKEFDFKIQLQDLNGSDYIHKYWIYLSKVYEIDKSQIESLYTPIKQQKYIRNKIAHSNSKIDSNKVQFVNQTKGLSVLSYLDIHELKVSDSTYVETILENGENFLKNLLKLIDNRYNEIKNNIKIS